MPERRAIFELLTSPTTSMFAAPVVAVKSGMYGIVIPMHHALADSDIAFVCDRIEAFASSVA
jgi:hypothetical protein